jgi:hypothetical protein
MREVFAVTLRLRWPTCLALVDHDRGHVSDVATIGACRDADRLDLTRLGIAPRAELMSTEAGRWWQG